MPDNWLNLDLVYDGTSSSGNNCISGSCVGGAGYY
ncbi:MAG: hypothetical protein ACI9BC_001904, partial [Crocinitomicaceae bacterium]